MKGILGAPSAPLGSVWITRCANGWMVHPSGEPNVTYVSADIYVFNNFDDLAAWLKENA